MATTPKPRPLGGLRILITRPSHENSPLANKLTELGAEVISHPVIRIAAAPDPDRVTECLSRLDDFSSVAFLSRNAAISFAVALSAFEKQSEPVPPIGAIGTGTKSALEQRGYSVEFMPEHSNSQSMATQLIERYRAKGYTRPILILRADRGSNVLPETLNQAGVPFVELPIYRSEDRPSAEASVVEELAAGKFDWITVTSSAVARNVARLFGDVIGPTKVVSISPTTSKAAREVGLEIAVEAIHFNADGLVAAIVKHQTTPE